MFCDCKEKHKRHVYIDVKTEFHKQNYADFISWVIFRLEIEVMEIQCKKFSDQIAFIVIVISLKEQFPFHSNSWFMISSHSFPQTKVFQLNTLTLCHIYSHSQHLTIGFSSRLHPKKHISPSHFLPILHLLQETDIKENSLLFHWTILTCSIIETILVYYRHFIVHLKLNTATSQNRQEKKSNKQLKNQNYPEPDLQILHIQSTESTRFTYQS